MIPNKLMSEVQIKQYDFDPDATTATAVAWTDMRDFSQLLISFFRTVGTGNLTFIIQGSAAADGSSPETIATKTISAQPNAVGDYVFAEVTAEQIAGIAATSGKALRYVSAVLTLATGTDEGVVTYVKAGARFKYDGLSADYVS